MGGHYFLDKQYEFDSDPTLVLPNKIQPLTFFLDI